MPEMSTQEKVFCRSLPWRWFSARVVLPWALQGQQLEGDVLELGSGSGSMSAELLARFPTARVVATDVDPEMAEATARSLAAFGERGCAQQADAAALPFDDASFDVVVAFLMLHHVGSWERALAESVRVLRSGGRLIGYDLLASPITELVHRRHVGGNGERLISWAELRPALEALPLAMVSVRRTGRVLCRFRATKQ